MAKRTKNSTTDHAECELRLRAVAGTALDSIFLKDMDRRYTFVNPAMTRLLGCREEDLLGRTPEEVFSSEDAAVIADVDRRALAGETVNEERDLVIDGELRSFHTIQVPYRDDEDRIIGICGIVREISERRRATRALAESENRLRERSEELARKNATLTEVLAHIESEKLEVSRQVTANVNNLILPAVQRLKRRAPKALRSEIELLERSLQDITSRFGTRVSKAVNLSPREMEVCNMIRNGMSTKEISESMGVTLRTVETHRNRIRRKLGIAHTGTSLVRHLQDMG